MGTESFNNLQVNEFLKDEIMLTCSKCQCVEVWNISEKFKPDNFICAKCENEEKVDKFQSVITKEIVDKFGDRFSGADFDRINFSKITTDIEIYKDCVSTLRNILILKIPIIVITGNNGLGKTFLAACIYRMCVLKNKNCQYFMADAFLEKYKSYYYGSTAERLEVEQLVEKMKRCDVLVLDEMTSIEATSKDTRILMEIVDWRYNRYKPVVMIGNLSPSQENFIKFFGSSLTDRILGEDNRIFYFEGESLR